MNKIGFVALGFKLRPHLRPIFDVVYYKYIFIVLNLMRMCYKNVNVS